MTRPLIVLAILGSYSLAAAAEKDWAGKQVMPKRPELKLGQWQGNRQTFSDLRGMDYTVKEEKDGWLLLRSGDHEGWGLKTEWVLLQDAPVHYTARLRRNKDDIWALSARGSAWDLLGEYDNAIKDFTECIRLEPGAADYYNRGMCYGKKKEYEAAIKDLTEAIRLDPKQGDYYGERGTVYFNRKEYEKAIKDYTESIRLDPGSINYRNRADTYRENKEYDKALKDINEALRLDPRNADMLNIRGLIFLDQSDRDRAITEFTAAIKADPKFIYAHNNRADAYRDKKEYDKALADYAEAIRIDPKSDYAYRNRGIAWERQKEYRKALKDYDAAAKADPKNEWNHNNRAWLLATCPDDDIRDGKRAVDAATKACELTEWKNASMLDTLAAAHAEAGDFDKAVKHLKQALALDDLDQSDRDAYRARLKLYEQKKPYRQ